MPNPVEKIITAKPKAHRMQKRIAFLQTDWEMGMSRLAQDLMEKGHEVRKIALNAADLYYKFRGIHVDSFRGHLEEWNIWLEQYVQDHSIDTFFVYNTGRPYNQIAEQVAKKHNIEVIMLEQGLIRPLHVTAFSTSQYSTSKIKSMWQDYLEGNLTIDKPSFPDQAKQISTPLKLSKMAFFTSVARIGHLTYPHYQDQLRLDVKLHTKALFRGASGLINTRDQKRIISECSGKSQRKYFLIPLQVPHDDQIVQASTFSNMDEFLDMIADSFSKFGSAEHRLIVKTHPMYDGYHDYSHKIDELKRRIGEDRISLIRSGSIDTLTSNALGIVTINSTVGMRALRHGVSVKVLGDAIYDGERLTSQKSLNEYWQNPEKPNMVEINRFVNLLETTIQGRGSLARRCFTHNGRTGIIWPKPLADSDLLS